MSLKAVGTANINIAEKFIVKDIIMKTDLWGILPVEVLKNWKKSLHADTWPKIAITWHVSIFDQ